MAEKLDLDVLERLARAATPGPWFEKDWSRDFGEDKTTVEARSKDILHPGHSAIWPHGIRGHRVAETEVGERPIEDAAFIAAANPVTVLSLIGRIRELEHAEPNATRSEPVGWMRRHPDGTLTGEFLTDATIEPVSKQSGAWVPVYDHPTDGLREITRLSNEVGRLTNKLNELQSDMNRASIAAFLARGKTKTKRD